MSHRIKPEEFERWNEEMAKLYDVDLFHHHHSSLIRFIEHRRVQNVLNLLDAKAGEKILEVGCGAGNVLEKITQGNLFGVDLSEHLLERARGRLGKRATLEKANAESLPYPDNTFDKVYCTEVLEHVLQPEQALKEMARVAKNGAPVIVSIPHERCINFGKTLVKKLGLFDFLFKKDPKGYPMPEKMEEGWHLRAFSLRMLRDFVPAALQEDQVERVPFFFLPLHYVVRYRLNKSRI